MRRKFLIGSAALLLSIMVKPAIARSRRISQPKNNGSSASRRNYSGQNSRSDEWPNHTRFRIVQDRDDEYDPYNSQGIGADDYESYNALDENSAYEELIDELDTESNAFEESLGELDN